MKIIGLKNQILLMFQLGDRDISRLTSLHPQVSIHARAKFLSGSQEFYKNGDKFGWVKYC